MSNNVYVNRTLNLKKIKYIGLDMDHTLIRYKTENFEKLAHSVMLNKLVNNLGYPKSILDLNFEFDRSIKGLVIDKSTGHLLKVSRFGGIKQSYHGLKPIDYYKRKKIFSDTFIDLSDSNFDTIDTNFSISFANLFAQLVELKDTTEFQTLPEYNQIAIDINQALDRAHQDGSYLRFMKIDPETGSMTNVQSKLTPGIYQGGSANIFTSDLNLDPGHILYIGDHIYGDIVRLKKDCAWRTGLILEELEDEVRNNKSSEDINKQIEALMAKKIPLETTIDELISDGIENYHKNNKDILQKQKTFISS